MLYVVGVADGDWTEVSLHFIWVQLFSYTRRRTDVLVFTLHDHVTFENGIRTLLDSVSRALGPVLSKVKFCKDLK